MRLFPFLWCRGCLTALNRQSRREQICPVAGPAADILFPFRCQTLRPKPVIASRIRSWMARIIRAAEIGGEVGRKRRNERRWPRQDDQAKGRQRTLGWWAGQGLYYRSLLGQLSTQYDLDGSRSILGPGRDEVSVVSVSGRRRIEWLEEGCEGGGRKGKRRSLSLRGGWARRREVSVTWHLVFVLFDSAAFGAPPNRAVGLFSPRRRFQMPCDSCAFRGGVAVLSGHGIAKTNSSATSYSGASDKTP